MPKLKFYIAVIKIVQYSERKESLTNSYQRWYSSLGLKVIVKIKKKASVATLFN